MAKPVEHKTLISIAGAVAPSLVKMGEKAGKVIDGVGKDVEATTGKIGKLRIGMLAAGAGIAAGAIAAGKAIWDMGGQMQRLSRDLRLGTGATGERLEALKSTALSTYKSIPISLEDAGKVVGNLNTLLGYSGKELDSVSRRVAALAQTTGRSAGDLSNDLGRIANAYSMDSKELNKFIDLSRKLAEDTGIDHARLTADIEKSGSTLREMGYSASTSAALIAKMSKLGSGQAEKFFAGMRKGSQVIKKGFKGDVRVGFAGVIEQIQNADEKTARLVATQVFGAEAGAIFYDQIKAGALDAGVYAKEMEAAAQNTESLAKATLTTEDRVELLQRSIKTRLMPAAESMLGWVDTALQYWTGPEGDAIFQSVKEFGLAFIQTAKEIGLGWGYIFSLVGDFATKFKEAWWRLATVPTDIFFGIVDGVTSAIEKLKTLAMEGFSAIESGLRATFGRIKELAAPVLEFIQPVLDFLGKTPQGKIYGAAFGAIKSGLGGLFGGGKGEAEALPQFASGGLATGPSIAGEAGPEYVVPLTGDREQNLSHWLAAGELLGASATNSNSSETTITFSPTINISGVEAVEASDIMEQIRAQGPAFVDYILSELDLHRSGSFGGA